MLARPALLAGLLAVVACGKARTPTEDPASRASAPDAVAPAAPTAPRDGAADPQAVYDAAIGAVANRPPVQEIVQIEGKPQVFYRWEQPRLIVSEAVCAPGGKLASCKALDAVRAIQAFTIPTGHGNPAASTCKLVGARLLEGKTDLGMGGYCQFDDGSLIADWSLIYVPDWGRTLLSH